jgi:hypothetical protein
LCSQSQVSLLFQTNDSTTEEIDGTRQSSGPGQACAHQDTVTLKAETQVHKRHRGDCGGNCGGHRRSHRHGLASQRHGQQRLCKDTLSDRAGAWPDRRGKKLAA